MTEIERFINAHTDTANGEPVDVVAETIVVSVTPETFDELKGIVKRDRRLKSLLTTHRGALGKLTEYMGTREKALRLIALGVKAGAWEIQSAVELLRQPREKAVEMTKNGFLYVKATTAFTSTAP